MKTQEQNSEILKTKKTDILSVDPKTLVIKEGFNIRSDYGDIQALADSIVSSGQQVPLKVSKIRGIEQYAIIDGYRRHQAICLAIEQGHSIPYVQVTLFNGNVEDEVFSMLITGVSQKQLNDVEQAEGIKRLIGFGYSVEEISKKVCRSVPQIYNLTYISNFPKKVKDAIIRNEISSSTALSIYREQKDTDKFINVVEEAIKNANIGNTTDIIRKATNKNVSSLKAKTQTQKLAEVYKKLIDENPENKHLDFLEIVLHKSKTMSVDELFEIFNK